MSPRHISVNIPDETFERTRVLIADRLRKNPQQTVSLTDILVDALNIGVKVMEAEAFSGIQLLISKEIS